MHSRIMDSGYDGDSMDAAFRRGLKAGKLLYLDNLKRKALQDYELHGESGLLEKAFTSMKQHIGTSGARVNSTSLKDWRRFGLSEDIIDRIGYIALQHDSGGTAAPVAPAAAGRGPSVPKLVAQQSDDYEEDFEEINEEDYQRAKQQQQQQQRAIAIAAAPASSSSKLSSLSSEDLVTPRMTSGPIPIPTAMHLRNPAHSNNTSTSTDSTPSAVRSSKSVSSGGGGVPAWITKGEWRLGEKIGSGSFGEVFQAMNNKGKLFAVKRLAMSPSHSSDLSKLLDEIALMRGLHHEHIVEYIGSFVDTGQGQGQGQGAAAALYIFQEWVPGGSLAQLLRKFGAFSLPVVRNYTRQILFGLVYLHGKGVVHRDIKGGNVLVDDSGVVKLADFGASTRLGAMNKTQETSTIQGTPYFMAPEVLANNRYGRKGDIWALGCTMIQMLTGEPPWKDMNLKGIVQLHVLLTGWTGPPPCARSDLTAEGKECLELCFRKNPDDRPTARELLKCAFLKDDELEDSGPAPLERSMGPPPSRGEGGDPLDDSGVMASLRQQMAAALDLNRDSGLAGSTLGEIDRRLADNNRDRERDRERDAKRRGSGSSTAAQTPNPFGSGGTPLEVRWSDALPAGGSNNFHTVASPSATPRSPVKPVGLGSPSKANPANPFARGSAATPSGDLRRIAARGPGPPPANPTSPQHSSGDELRRSLQGIKKKAHSLKQNPNPNPSGSVTPSSISSPPPRGSAAAGPSLSSARDEDLTPQPLDSSSSESDSDDSDAEADGMPLSRGRLDRGGRAPMNRYDTRYFDSKHEGVGGDLHPLGSAEREVSSESVEDMTGAAFYSESPVPAPPRTDPLLFRRPREDKEAPKEVLVMKKSASAADSLGSLGPRRVPRLSALSPATSSTSISTSSSMAVSKSISARIHRPERAAEEARPFTSKAALGTHSEGSGGGERHRDRDRTVRQVISPAVPDPGQAEAAGPGWTCLKCNARNHRGDGYCGSCATMRGAPGRRGNDSAIIYRI